MVEWPVDLVRDIARRRCVIVVGSGVSRQAIGIDGAKPPTWKQFLLECNDELKGGPKDHISSAIREGDLLHACEWLQNEYQQYWKDRLRGAFNSPKFEPTEVHRLIARLDSRIIFSLNFEEILDRAVQDVLSGTCVTKRYYDEGVSEFLRGTDRYLVKVHGSLHEIERIIFTQRQYAEARVKSAAFYQAFDSALMTHTFLFLGAGTQDPDINLVLENQNFTYSNSHPHYFLSTPEIHADMKRSLRENRNLEVVVYDPLDNDYSGFTDAIRQLLDEVDAERQEMAHETRW